MFSVTSQFPRPRRRGRPRLRIEAVCQDGRGANGECNRRELARTTRRTAEDEDDHDDKDDWADAKQIPGTGLLFHRFSRHFVPGYDLLSLRDKAILPSKGHTIILAFMGLQSRGYVPGSSGRRAGVKTCETKWVNLWSAEAIKHPKQTLS